jgi:transcriptional regulator with XRE-family HTH domain
VPRVAEKSDSEVRTLKALGDAIRIRRNELRMSQEALADAARITRTHMGEVERGSRNVSLLAVIRIAAAMKCRASDLMGQAGL